MTKQKIFSAAMIVASLTITAPQAAFAKGEEPPTTKNCSKGKVLDKKTGKCVQAESNLIIDDERYDAVREYAYHGDYDGALSILATFEDQNDPRVHNYHGFINRKRGNIEVAMAHYSKALEIDPDYVLARSYMGQGLVAAGDTYGAYEQLSEIRTRGGEDTWAYKALAKAIRGEPTDY